MTDMRSIRPSLVLATSVLVVSTASFAFDCDVPPLPADPGAMSNAEFEGALGEHEQREADISAKIRSAETKQNTIERFTEYHRLGYDLRTNECGAQSQEALELRQQIQQRKSEAKNTDQMVERYKKLIRVYNSCMDSAIAANSDFRKLLENDPGATSHQSKDGDLKRLHSFATANGRYQELKAEVVPAGTKEMINTYVTPQQKMLDDELNELRDCLSRVSIAKESLREKRVKQLLGVDK